MGDVVYPVFFRLGYADLPVDYIPLSCRPSEPAFRWLAAAAEVAANLIVVYPWVPATHTLPLALRGRPVCVVRHYGTKAYAHTLPPGGQYKYVPPVVRRILE